MCGCKLRQFKRSVKRKLERQRVASRIEHIQPRIDTLPGRDDGALGCGAEILRDTEATRTARRAADVEPAQFPLWPALGKRRGVLNRGTDAQPASMLGTGLTAALEYPETGWSGPRAPGAAGPPATPPHTRYATQRPV